MKQDIQTLQFKIEDFQLLMQDTMAKASTGGAPKNQLFEIEKKIKAIDEKIKTVDKKIGDLSQGGFDGQDEKIKILLTLQKAVMQLESIVQQHQS